jgi:2-keto-4-pentenoate hydratase
MTAAPNSAPNDPAALRGLKRALEDRQKKLDAGSQPLGWKVGFGGPAALEMLGISRPLVGYLLHDGLLASGTTVSIKDWTKPVAEPEICVTIGHDLPGGGDKDAAAAAIAGIGPAIELADVVVPPENAEDIVAANINHRAVLLGGFDRSRAGAHLDGLAGHVMRSGKELALVEDLEANTGKLIDIVRSVADTLGDVGETLREGEIIIAGSVTPPIFLEPEDFGISFDLVGLGAVSVTFS